MHSREWAQPFQALTSASPGSSARANSPARRTAHDYAAAAPVSCDVQFGQRLAAIGMSVAHCGHGFVFGAAGGPGM